MSELPAGWEWTTTQELFTFVTSGSRGWARYYSEEGAPFIRVGNLQRGSIKPDFTELQRVSPPEGSEGSRTRVQDNDILISITADLGRVALMCDVKEDSFINQHIALARPIEDISARYLAWYLSSPGVQRQWMKQQHGATKLGLGLEDIWSISVPLPPRPEQERVVAAIEEQLSRLDVGVAALERVRKNLKRARDAVLRAAVCARLLRGESTPIAIGTSADRPLSTSLSPENARKVEQATKDLMPRTWEIPSSWTWKAAADVCEVIASGSTPAQAAMSPDRGDIPYIKVYNLTHRGNLDFTIRPTFIDRSTHEGPLRRSQLLPGDILTNIVGPPLGKVSVVPADYPEWNTNQAVVVFRPVESLNPKLLKYWLLSSPVLGLLESTSRATAGQFNVSLTTCRAVPLPIPPRSDQDAIVATIEDRLSVIDAQEAIIDRLLIRSGILRSAILCAAFSGNLVPQDPADEPASKVLQRISAARASSNGHRLARGRKPKELREEVTP